MTKKNKRFKLTEKNFNSAKAMLAGNNTLKNISLSIGCSPAVVSRIRGVKTFYQYKTEQKAWSATKTTTAKFKKQANLFLQDFQELERLIRKNSESNDSTRFRDALEKISEKNIIVKRNKHLIESMYALRNIFAHQGRGKYIAQINSDVFKELKEIIESIKKPPTAKSEFSRTVYEVDTNEEVYKVMKKMKAKTYTHVPVRENGTLIGVFSYTSLFSWLTDSLKHNSTPTFTKIIMGDINKKYLNSSVVNYQIIEESTILYDIPTKFEEAITKNDRLDCLLITTNGKKTGKISSIITSWDLATIK